MQYAMVSQVYATNNESASNTQASRRIMSSKSITDQC